MLAPLIVAVASAAQPNIVVFLVDDLGWQDTSVLQHVPKAATNDHFRTPAMERLAREGVVFTDAYSASPVCSPTRTSIMTGQNPARTHITHWVLHPDRDTSSKHPGVLPPDWNRIGIQPSNITLPGVLRDAGYHTIHVGKAHFGALTTEGADPTNLGFDVNIAGHAPGGPGSYYGIHRFQAQARQGKEGPSVWDVPGLEAYHDQDVFLTDVLAIEACKAMRAAHDADEPFFLHFAPYAVHSPIMAHPKKVDDYNDLHPREAAYASMVEATDDALGAVLDTLDELGIADNTLVIFTSDNGGLSAVARGGEKHTHNRPLSSGKGSIREGGIRVPMIVRWPGHATAGIQSREPVIAFDIFPTALAAANTRAPGNHMIDGRDLASRLDGSLGPERAIIVHHPHRSSPVGPGIEPATSIRRGQWKLIHSHDDGAIELFDLERDLAETTNLAAAYRNVAVRLAGELTGWLVSAGAQPSIDAESGQPVGWPSVP